MDIQQLLKFLTGLKKNNQKEWFDANRKTYESLRKDWLLFVQEMIDGIATFDKEIAGIQAKDCIFRINKDIRFSKDKSPYKTNFGASINVGGKKQFVGGYYLHIEPGEIFTAGGVYMPEPPKLAAIRQEVDYHWDEFKKIVENKTTLKNLVLEGEKLSRPPKGYEADNPAIEYLKMKSMVFVQRFDPKELQPKEIHATLLDSFKRMKPFNDFLRRAD